MNNKTRGQTNNNLGQKVVDIWSKFSSKGNSAQGKVDIFLDSYNKKELADRYRIEKCLYYGDRSLIYHITDI